MTDERDNQDIDTIVAINTTKQVANSELGITQEYNKRNRDKLWDSDKGKSNFKDKKFGDKQTYLDPISGKKLHKSQDAAKNKYHMKNSEGEKVSSEWAKYSAETDHINALKDVHKKAKHNPFLTDADFKEIMNSDENYRILSKSTNTSKGDKNDWQVILDKDSKISSRGKRQMAKEKVKSDVVLTGKFAARTGKNVGKEFINGGKDALVNSAIPLVSEAVSKMVNVAQGKQNMGDAAKDMAKKTVGIVAAGGKSQLLVDVVSSQFANSKNTILQNIAGSNQVAQIIAVASIVKESALRYISGEIDGQEFIDQVGAKGTVMVVGMIGGEVGREIGRIIGMTIGTTIVPGLGTGVGYVVGDVIGKVLGTIITTVACSTIVTVINCTKHLNDYKLKEHQIRRLETDALREMEYQRGKFKEIIEKEYKVWDENIQDGLELMIMSACEEDCNIQGVTAGLDKVLAVFGKKVRFNTIEEYEEQLDMPLKLSF